MPEVTRFRSIRADGKVIDESMTVADMLARGWNPATVVAIEWESAGDTVSLRSEDGVAAHVVPGRRFVAVIERGVLRILHADGSPGAAISSVQTIRGRQLHGSFAWFEPPRTQSMDAFGSVFLTGGNGDFQIDVDAATGRVLGVHETR